MQDYYQVLGIAPDASTQVVRIAFEGRMKALADPAYAASAEQKAREERLLKEAFVTLSMPAKRGPYDARLAASEPEGPAEARARPAWVVPAVVATVLALAAGGLWTSHSREKERIRLQEERLAMEKEAVRRRTQIEEERIRELALSQAAAAEAARQRGEAPGAQPGVAVRVEGFTVPRAEEDPLAAEARREEARRDAESARRTSEEMRRFREDLIRNRLAEREALEREKRQQREDQRRARR